jgi:membrane-bound lytic murein transglycosylase A
LQRGIQAKAWSIFATFLLSVVVSAAASQYRPLPMSAPELEPIKFDNIAGWEQDEHSEAFRVFARSCSEIVEEGRGFAQKNRFGGDRADWMPVCRAASKLGLDISNAAARGFFETHFAPVLVQNSRPPSGFFTGYYEPEAHGDRQPHGKFAVPIYAKPSDLVRFDADTERRLGYRYGRLENGEPRAYFTRRQIEEGALAGRGLEIAWLQSWADAFFIHVQGSGRVRLPNGEILRLAFAAKSGHPYTAIGGVLVERGEISHAEMSMQSIRDWMNRNPHQARQLMWENQSFVFFREVAVENPSLGPPGAARVQLTPYRSLAIDRAFWAFGTPLWVDTRLPVEGPGKIFRQLTVAQDTGSAIKGAARGDIFFGFGEDAAHLAGHMKSEGRMIALLPKLLARRLAKGAVK